MEDRKVTIAQAAQELGVSRDAVWRAVKSDQIPAEQFGRMYVMLMSDARRWFETSYDPKMAKKYPSKAKK